MVSDQCLLVAANARSRKTVPCQIGSCTTCAARARTLLSRAGVNPDVAERCLGHSLGSIRAIYDRHGFENEMLHAFERSPRRSTASSIRPQMS